LATTPITHGETKSVPFNMTLRDWISWQLLERLARTLIEKPKVHIRMFLIGDAVTCARKEQKPPTGYYMAKLLGGMVEKGAEIGACGVCMDARGSGTTTYFRVSIEAR
jgi:sulfur relay (sulfurtransferase) complex TusBCD TusD component (DsrE family)